MEKYPHTASFAKHYQRYLNQLSKEVQLFKSDAALWEVRGDITNSAGNLTLHLVGNLQHFLGASLHNTGYVRQREAEFSTKSLSKIDLVQQVEETATMVQAMFESMGDADLHAEYPHAFGGEKGSVLDYLLRFLWHLSYHIGQINYLRRVLDLPVQSH